MSGTVKISELTSAASVEATDLLEISEDLGGGSYASKKATALQVKTYALGTQYMTFTGPATSQKTYTLPNASATILTTNAAVTAAQGGTGQTSYTIGDLLYASGATALSKLAGVATGNALVSGGVGAAPAWGKIGLTTHISGTLGVGNGGTGATSLTGVLKGNGSGAFTASNVNLTAEVTGILPAANGGTGNGFTAFTGPASSTKTFTLPNASATVHTSAGQGNGSAGAPAYSFSAETDTGMYRVTTDTLAFSTGGTERFRLTNTYTFLYTTSGSPNPGFAFQNIGTMYIGNNNGAENFTWIQFMRNATYLGGIAQVSTTGVAYTTNSDHRLKDYIKRPESSREKLMSLPVREYTWKATPDAPPEIGFFAHEVQDVAPFAVVGAKDAVNEDGSIKSQGLDYSRLVPLIVAALQDVWTETEALKPTLDGAATLTRSQFFRVLARSGLVTPAAAAESARTGVMPPALATLLVQLPEADRVDAEILWATATHFIRSSPLFQVAVANGLVTDAQLDTLFALGKTLP